MMQLQTATTDNITVVKPFGSMLSEADLLEAMAAVNKLIMEGHKQFVFDLTDVNTFNSNGLNWLVATLTKTRRADGDTVLMNIPAQLEKLLIITKLHLIFHTVPDLEGALIYFNNKI